MDEAAIRKYAEEQIARRLADLRLYADQQIRTGQTTADQQRQSAQSAYNQFINNARTMTDQQLQALQTGYDRQRETIGQDRNVENVQNARRLSPFSGRSDYALGMIAQQRGRTDREMLQDLQGRQANLNENYANAQSGANQNLADINNAVAQDLANLQNTINEKYAAMQNAAPEEIEALFQSIKNDERNYELMLRGELRNDMLANSQLNNTAFQQALQGYNANRSAFEADRAFDYGRFADMVNWTGQIPGGQTASTMSAQGGQTGMRTLAGQQMDLQQQQAALQRQQANNDAALQWSQMSGQILSPQQDWSGYSRQIQQGGNPLTLSAQQQQFQQAQQEWENAFAQNQFDQQKAQQAWENAFKNRSFEQDMKDAAASRGLQWASLNQRQKEFVADQEWREKQFEYQQQLDALEASQQDPTDLDSIMGNINERFVQSDPLSGQTSITNTAALRNYIISLGLPDNQTDQLLIFYGLPTN